MTQHGVVDDVKSLFIQHYVCSTASGKFHENQNKKEWGCEAEYNYHIYYYIYYWKYTVENILLKRNYWKETIEKKLLKR